MRRTPWSRAGNPPRFVQQSHTGCFFLLGFILALHMKHSAHALLGAFAIWLLLVLIAPQIGDTRDPDNQVARGGVPAAEHFQARSGRDHEEIGRAHV